MLAALSVIAAYWGNDPAAETVITLAEQSKDLEVRARIARRGAMTKPITAPKNE
jgi:hypothetical protein